MVITVLVMDAADDDKDDDNDEGQDADEHVPGSFLFTPEAMLSARPTQTQKALPGQLNISRYWVLQ